MAKAYKQSDFNNLMEIVQNVDVRVNEYLELEGYDKWSRVYVPVYRGWTMILNIAESINSALIRVREKSIYNFLEEVRKMFERWNCTNRQKSSFTSITLDMKFQEILTINNTLSAWMTVINVLANVLAVE
ncbi:uncharacterized protein LOC107857978 [Capsicum annuum]|uniref:uncharacterized protein LOC107857978 n=1 Tax=Capsicum annuum TaxID=4072 RepID=UPI001FB10F6F|nr:uncharacterized protein LOC107857978 [Capsicum annuum]